jgi:hypothetical protein
MNIDEILVQLTLRNNSWRDAIWANAEIDGVEPNWIEVEQVNSYENCLRDIAKALGRSDYESVEFQA